MSWLAGHNFVLPPGTGGQDINFSQMTLRKKFPKDNRRVLTRRGNRFGIIRKKHVSTTINPSTENCLYTMSMIILEQCLLCSTISKWEWLIEKCKSVSFRDINEISEYIIEQYIKE